MVSAQLYLAFLALVGLQRLGELAVSRRNARWCLAHGGIETGQRHLVWMKLLHAGFLGGCALEVVWLERPFVPALGIPMLALALTAQCVRLWTVSALGRHWNVRVIVVPGMPAVSSGPYRFLRHPNYLAVVIEGLAIPLVHGAWTSTLLFSLANALLLRARIRCEEQALSRHTDYRTSLEGRGALVPRCPARDAA